MELAGGEKQIRALFSELRFADEQLMPSFTSTWRRAQSRSLRPQPALKLSFVAATALLVCALAGLAWWSRQWSQSNPSTVTTFSPPPVPSTTPAPTFPELTKPGTNAAFLPGTKPHSIKHTVRRGTEQAALAKIEIRNAATISNWQSPTDSLMRSPGEQVLTTLPQLNDAATQLKSFLPDRDK